MKKHTWITGLLILMWWLAMGNSLFAISEKSRPSGTQNDKEKGLTSLVGFTLYAETPALQLFVNEGEGLFAVYVKASKALWYSSPPGWQTESFASGFNKNTLPSMLTIRTVDVNSSIFPANGYTNVVRRSGLAVSAIPGGVRFEHTFTREGITVPVDVRLEGRDLVVSVPLQEIKTDPEVGLRLIDFTLLPYFGAASSSEEGYLLVPDGSGALIYFNNRKSKQPYQQYVYGRDPVIQPLMKKEVSEKVYLPVFGLKRKDGGFFAIIEEGASRAWINGETAYQRTSYNAASASCIVLDSDVVSFREKTGTPRDILIFENVPYGGNFQVRYILLSPEEADYVSMAEIYRNYLIEKKNYTPSSFLKSEPSLLVNFIGASPKVKPFLGFPKRQQIAFTSFGVGKAVLEQLRTLGVDHLVVKYDGWEKGGLYGDYATSPLPASSLGGERGLKNFLSWTAARQIPLFLGTEPVALYRSSFSLIPELHTNKTVNRAPAQVFPYRMSTFEKLTTNKEGAFWFLKTSVIERTYQKYLERFVKRWQDEALLSIGSSLSRSIQEKIPEAPPMQEFLGLSPDSMGNLLASDFTPKGYNREDTRRTFETLLQQTAQKMPVLLSRPFDYALPYVDFVCDVPVTSSMYEIEDVAIPFYQMVLKGFKPFTNIAYNQALDPLEAKLFMLESGAYPSVLFVGEHPEELRDSLLEPYMSSYAYDWLDKTAALYRELFPLLRQIKDVPIREHQVLSKKVRRVVYANGIGFYINYGERAETIGSITIPARSFVRIGG
ncbi:DUF5696 domain-containing protein [Treponema sp. J25]|uniref:DUF5696 domain-containing protein n=1 Tax=Treponema sp. J25 TaxID=2094121 RepID=UPI001046D05F|nr:DUF5696 domain-containing protein [Treponema sp. J25]TCW61212.1 hypothetical protein C5O22_07470 [Treponema sp. J25]